MKESLIDIVNSIDSCATARKGTGLYPIARVHCDYNGHDETIWFTNGERSTSMYGFDDVNAFGRFVSKNSDIAIRLQKMDVGGSFDYERMNYIKRMEKYHVVLENRSDFQNQTIAIANHPLLYQYRNIKEFLEALRQNKDDIADILNHIAELKELIEQLKNKKNTATQRGQISKSIKEFEKEYRILTLQQEDLKNITIYIRKQGEMRYSLIVDKLQTTIKSQNLFDGTTVIIEGGPGTGKSTTMIHRLAYLTDTFAIDEDEKKRIFRL